ncbi:MAG TPA: hypothetical protein QF804_01710 [Rhodospirillales bacterium]|jgi:hypothetical protein|nr:hypothetical protein [Rhodospirillales bacterium]HJO68382.1 hypothetical protein [Rhodospirillales bacterium]
MLKKAFRMIALALVIPIVATVAARAQPAPELLSIELNALNQNAAACQVYVVIDNVSEVAFAKFSTDLVLFDNDGLILKRLTTDFGRLRPNKIHVMSFVVDPLECAAVGRVVLNDVIDCEHDGSAGVDCIDAIRLSHRGDVGFEK